MADGDSTNISEVLGSTVQDAGVNPVKQEASKWFEEAVSSLTGSTDPQAQAQKEQHEAEQKAKDAKDAAYQREWLAKLAEEEAKARQAAQQKEAEWQQRNEVRKQEDQAKKFVEQQKEASVNQAVYNAERSKEQRNGVGG